MPLPRHRFWKAKHQPFLRRIPPIKRQKSKVTQVSGQTSGQSVSPTNKSESSTRSRPLDVSQSASSVFVAIANAAYSSDSSIDRPSTVKKGPGHRPTPDSEDDDVQPVAQNEKATEPDAIAGKRAQFGTTSLNNASEAETSASMATNGMSAEDLDSDAMDDMEEEMPQPMQPEYELKRIQLDEETSLVVVDPRTFGSEAACVTLINGCVQVQLVHGNMSLNGYELKTDSPVKGCTGGSKDFILMEGQPFDSSADEIRKSLKSALHPKFTAKVIREISSYDNYPHLSVLLVTKWDNSRIELIKAMLAYRLPNPHQLHAESFFDLSFSKNCSSIGREWMPLIQRKILDNITSQSVVMVVGPPESGKSVLMRRIVNHIMSIEGNYGLKDKVIIVDLDAGQSEFSSPAQVTAVELHFTDEPLISRPFAHTVLFADRIIAAVSVGSIDMAEFASVYTRGVRHLMDQVRVAIKDSPCAVFVITSGFVRGLGRSLLIDAIRIVHPTDVIEIKESLDIGNDCRSDLVYSTRAMGFQTDASSCAERKGHTYVDLKCTAHRTRPAAVNQRNRNSQILAVLSRDPKFLTMSFKYLKRIPIDLNNLFHFTNPMCFSVPAVMDKLHLAFVQLVRTDKKSSGDTRTRGMCVTSDLDCNTILGYGVLFVTRKSGSEEAEVEVAVTCDAAQEANCIVVPAGVSLPVSLISTI